ncbi:peptide chain release factor N(5)-glutamine methyltransferase [Pontivivens ytuae]|uniref:Release factor glutamine methyltransferase n=1 Tax=Pontivivens ytuae TaxID=2789856 RepID=A0A7S9LRF0_9RHOB|nr:peptide chain release factor N(5)-glutamine methyltransferase [Pontivivens ytuae]QPH53912.1 peptide chain release factor N(5)-glutamine methyltransferase [Pontivivens ytuae]
MTVAELLAEGIAALRAAGVPGAERDARRLMEDLAGGHLSARMGDEVSEPAVYRARIAARTRRQPVAQILGRRAFWGRDFEVTPDVLDPRPETETLIEAALAGPTPRRILDLGTGSGAILATLLAEWSEARGVATDLSAPARAVAERNLATHAPGRFEVIAADWFEGVTGSFDLIVSNPPYIAADEMAELAPDVRDWEPHLALTPGGDGLDAYRAISKGYHAHLAPGGRMLLEIGAAQGESAAALFAPAPVEVLRDLDGRARVLKIVSADGTYD